MRSNHRLSRVCIGCGDVGCDPDACWEDPTLDVCSECDAEWPCAASRLLELPEHVELATTLERVVDSIRALHTKTDDATCAECVDDLDGYGGSFGNLPWPCSTLRTLDDALGIIPTFVVLTRALDDQNSVVTALTLDATVCRVEVDADGDPFFSFEGLDHGDMTEPVAYLFVTGERSVEVRSSRIVMSGVNEDDPLADLMAALAERGEA